MTRHTDAAIRQLSDPRGDCESITDRGTRLLALAALGDGAIDALDALFIDENPGRANEVEAFVAWLAKN